MPNEPLDPNKLLDRLWGALADDMLAAEIPIEAVRGTLVAAGLDPAEVGRDAGVLTAELLDRSAHSSSVEQMRKRRSGAELVLGRMNREQLVARIAALRSNPDASVSVGNRIRRQGAEALSDEELRQILAELEVLFADEKEPGRK
jgi:hypothetical protein